MEKKRCRGPLGALVALVLVLSMGACSGDDDADDPARPGPSDPGSSRAERVVQLKASTGKVTGALPRKVHRRVVAKVAKRVDQWFVAAWLGGEYPRKASRKAMGRAWPGFTRGLSVQARKDLDETTNARLAPRIDDVTAVRKKVKVDILAVHGRAAGATARFRLVFDTSGDVERRVQVRGQLSLTQAGNGWKVFGYDVRRSQGAIPEPGQGAERKKDRKAQKAKEKRKEDKK